MLSMTFDWISVDLSLAGAWAFPELESKGVKILVHVYEIGGWNEAFIEDPNGIWVEFLQRR